MISQKQGKIVQVSIHYQSLLSLRQARTKCSLHTHTAYLSPLD